MRTSCSIPMIQAFREVVNSFPESILIIAGDNQHLHYVQSLKQKIKHHNLDKHVKVITELNHNKIEQYFQCADIFVSMVENPAESFGLSVFS